MGELLLLEDLNRLLPFMHYWMSVLPGQVMLYDFR